ncbi:hypothetical protein F4819DRAFT_53232 [Hypoxylon fuscum]|nr:hypothetical protein F4819DRAFT_53232 [Hypoxylon fuscum]
MMHLPFLLLISLSYGTMAAMRFHVTEPARVRNPTPTKCTSLALTTTTTINRGNEGIWVVKSNISDLHELYKFKQTDWLSNDHQRVLDECSSICLQGNDTTNPGTWLPSDKYFQGAFVNTPGGNPPDHILWQCACYDRPVSSQDLASGSGVWNNANPGSGTIINREC